MVALQAHDSGAVDFVDAEERCDLFGVLPGDSSAREDDEAATRIGNQLTQVCDVVHDGRVCRSAMREDALQPPARQARLGR